MYKLFNQLNAFLQYVIVHLTVERFDDELEGQFLEVFFNNNLGHQRRGLIGIIILSLLFGSLEFLVPLPARGTLLALHYGVFCPILFAMLGLTYAPLYSRWSQRILAIGTLLAGLTYIYMETVTPTHPKSEASQTTVILILIVLSTNAVLRMRFTSTLIGCWGLFAAYLVTTFFLFTLPNAIWNVSALFIACGLVSIGAWSLENIVRNSFLLDKRIEEEKNMSEELLLTILPAPVAARLKSRRSRKEPIADELPDVTVLFADLVSFTTLAGRMTPRDVVRHLNTIFSEFDRLAELHRLDKIKTIGDAYMIAGGLFSHQNDHAESVANFALDVLTTVEAMKHKYESLRELSVRIGINIGPLVGGVIGEKKFIYDLWGDTVNVASRMESHGEAGAIQVTEAFYNRLNEKYTFKRRLFKTNIKGKGRMTTYWLQSRR